MKIAIDARVLHKNNLRGIGNYLFNLVDSMIKIDNSNQFILFYNHASSNKYIPKSDKIEEVQSEIKGDRLYLWEQIRLPLALASKKVDLFHNPANTVPLVQPCPTVVTLHDTLLMDLDEDESRGFLFYTRRIIPFGLKKAKKIITVSNNSKKDIIKCFGIPDKKIEVIYSGMDKIFRKLEDKDKAREAMNIKYGINKKYILHLGAAGPRKNTLRVIEIFSILKKSKKIEHKLLIAGLNSYAMNYFSKIIKELELSGEVILIEFVSTEDLVYLYNGAEIFIYLSLYEGFGFPPLEAMACGCPVIASNVSSLPELINNQDSLVDPANADSIIQKILVLLFRQDFRDQNIAKGLDRVKLFDWKKTAEETLAVYENLVYKSIKD